MLSFLQQACRSLLRKNDIYFGILLLDFLCIGVFTFLSYRDPNLLKTIDVYDGTGDFLRQLEMDNETLTKAIIGTIGDVDSYQLPDAKGYSRYVCGWMH